jgi:hypothetical protein
MKILKFRCILQSDVILNQKAATEGPNKTLDFIPGSCFLGVAAASLYDDFEKMDETSKKKMITIFHSGKVRFGDAHPSKGNKRGLKIPASLFYPKLGNITDGEVYVHHRIPDEKLSDKDFKSKQIKQSRSGFYIFDTNTATEVKTDTNFAIKSAYDKEKRRSKDQQMYGYESLQKGLELLFEVEVDDETLVEDVKLALEGEDKRIGRSRTAQYGLVKIQHIDDYDEPKSNNSDKNEITVYADGRLIFLDGYGQPTFQPTINQLLGKSNNENVEGKILWDKSQIRTFQYAPWNYHRQCFDADRCGIEKGSVFVIQTSQKEFHSQYIGSFRNEGFGKVIYNPDFLNAEEDGKTLIKFEKDKDNPQTDSSELSGTPLLDYLNEQKSKEEVETLIYTLVNKWVDDNKDKFQGETFASQWGTIRSIAMRNKSLKKIKYELFERTTTRNGQTIPDAYLTHGVAAEKWSERGRKKAFEDFINGYKSKDDIKFNPLTDDNVQMAIINLAAEMAKKCKEGR